MEEQEEIEIDDKQNEQQELFHVLIDEGGDFVQNDNLNDMQAGELEGAEIVIAAQKENQSDKVTDSQSTSGGKQRSRCGGPPGFITMMITHFREGVVSHLDRVSRDAILENKDFDDPAVFARVKSSVTTRVLQWLQEHGDKDSVPTIQFFNNIVDILGQKYPAMFSDDPCELVDGKKVRKFSSRGTGGLNGIRGMKQ
jgi:hypothetical protein